jgi:hypothetical protein|tara:strand:+ start:1258 stop:1467 length:210 start_codon:yes stop_codon:yes gene_type:complete
MISKQKRNLINELSFWLMREVEQVNDSTRPPIEKKTEIKTMINIIKSSKDYTNKQIKELIHDLKYDLPF